MNANRGQRERNKHVIQGISWNDRAFLKRAQDRAKSLHLSLSAYVCFLVREDLKRGGPFTLDAASSDEKLEEVIGAVASHGGGGAEDKTESQTQPLPADKRNPQPRPRSSNRRAS